MFDEGAGGRLERDGFLLWWVEGEERVSVPALLDFDVAPYGGRLHMLVAVNFEDGGVVSELVHDTEIWRNPVRLAVHEVAVDGRPTLLLDGGVLQAEYATADGASWRLTFDGSRWGPPTPA